MTTSDPTLAERLAKLPKIAQGGSIGDEWLLNNRLGEAYRSGQLITLADVEAMVLAENEACAKIAQPNGYQPECCRDTMSAIASVIRARVKPHNNEVA